MNGNTHFDAAALYRPQLATEETANEHYLAEEGVTDETMQFAALNRIAEATLALAYEQRTANLIALAAMGVVDMTDWPANASKEWNEHMVVIGTRVGINQGEAK